MAGSDFINAVFESFGGLFIGLSCWRLHQHKKALGISLWHVWFFMAWGYWNLYYYPSLGQWWSFAGGVGVVIANTIWFVMILYYRLRHA